MRLLLRVVIAGALAVTATMISAELLSAMGMKRSGLINTAICCLWPIAVYGVMQRQARPEN